MAEYLAVELRAVGVAAGSLREDRGVYHAQSRDAKHARIAIDDGQGITRRTHLAGAGWVEHGAHILLDEGSQFVPVLP